MLENPYFDYPIASSWFWKATGLKYLNLGYNRLFGQFPQALGNMTSLQVLDVSVNDIVMAGSFKNLCILEVLDISSNGINEDIAVFMEGVLPGRCNKLQELYLGGNSFTGALPNMISHFTSLLILAISHNSLTGSIPPELGNVACLQTLDLSYNKIDGPMPPRISHLTSLSSLDVSGNQLSGSVPAEISALTNLSFLNLENNNFSGIIREEHFAGLISLRGIDMSSNNLKIVVASDWLPPFRLEYASFASCELGPLFPAWLQSQTKIGQLDISNTALTDKIPEWFWSTFSQATYVDISQNQISGSLSAHLDVMAFMILNFSSNNLSGPIPPLPRNITRLDMSNNLFSGTLPSNLEAPQLKTLLLYSNKIGGSIPKSICKSKQLCDLDLSGNFLMGDIPQCFETLPITFLLLSNNSLSGKFPAALRNKKYMRFLDLASNKFSGRIPKWIGELTELQFLRLSYNMFFGNIPVEITNLRHLRFLDLSNNYISGVIPCHLSKITFMAVVTDGFYYDEVVSSSAGDDPVAGQFGDILSIITKGQQLRYGVTLEYFVSIDLSGNTLTGEVPKDITLLYALMNLNLSSNQLSGDIPYKIGALKSLVSLDLSKNKLSSEIPSSLSNLTSLSYLNLSYNNLSGRIPSGRQLDTINADNPSLMYIGNSGLCGPPVKKNCSRNGTFIHGYLRSNKQEFEPTSFYFALGLGLVVGLWMVFCVLLFKKAWRIAYFRLFDKLYDRVYVFVVVNWASLARKATTE